MIDWNDPKSKISKYFTVHESTFLPRLGNHYPPTDAEKDNIVATALVMDKVRELLGKPITVNVWIRPTAAKDVHGNVVDYNHLIGGAPSSSHIHGQAVDFSCNGFTVDEVLDLIEPKCMEWGFALENNGSVERINKYPNAKGGPRNWVHLQIRPLTIKPEFRVFNP